MLFSEFAQILFKHTEHSLYRGMYVIELFDFLLDDEKNNPFKNNVEDTMARYFNGKRKFSVKKISVVFSHKDEYKFAEYIDKQSASNQIALEKELASLIPTFTTENTTLGFACADLFVEILNDIIEDQEHSYKDDILTSPAESSKMMSIPTSSVYYDPADNKLHIGDQTMTVPQELLPPETISLAESPYIQELLSAFADALGQENISIEALPESYIRKFKRQRMNFYSASRIDRFVRESIDSGDEQVETWKADTFDYIEETLDDDYVNAERRLNTVMQKVVDSRTTSVIDQFQNLVGPKERKGVCHLLVNDEKFKWVDTNE